MALADCLEDQTKGRRVNSYTAVAICKMHWKKRYHRSVTQPSEAEETNFAYL